MTSQFNNIPNFAVFVCGLDRAAVEEVWNVQQYLPCQILYLRPRSNLRIDRIAGWRPTAERPMQLLISTADNTDNVHYCCEVVGWDDTTNILPSRDKIIGRVVNEFQKTNTQIYRNGTPGKNFRNVLHVWRMQKLVRPFRAANLSMLHGARYSPEYTEQVDWCYVKAPDQYYLNNMIYGP